MLPDFYNLTQTQINAAVIFINLLISLALGLFIVWIYRITHRGLSYSTSLVFTLLAIALIATTVMMVVQHNIVGALALLGAFSLIRFRTIVKDTRDVAFVFFALASGVAVGTNNYGIALTAIPFIGLVIWLATRWNLGSRGGSQLNYILTFISDFPHNGAEIEEALKISTNNARRLSVRTSGEAREYSYILGLTRGKNADEVISRIANLKGVRDVHLLSAQEAWEQ